MSFTHFVKSGKQAFPQASTAFVRIIPLTIILLTTAASEARRREIAGYLPVGLFDCQFGALKSNAAVGTIAEWFIH